MGREFVILNFSDVAVPPYSPNPDVLFRINNVTFHTLARSCPVYSEQRRDSTGRATRKKARKKDGGLGRVAGMNELLHFTFHFVFVPALISHGILTKTLEQAIHIRI